MYGTNLKVLINKLEERGVLNRKRAKALRRVADQLDSPTGYAVRHVLVKVIVEIISDVINGK